MIGRSQSNSPIGESRKESEEIINTDKAINVDDGSSIEFTKLPDGTVDLLQHFVRLEAFFRINGEHLISDYLEKILTHIELRVRESKTPIDDPIKSEDVALEARKIDFAEIDREWSKVERVLLRSSSAARATNSILTKHKEVLERANRIIERAQSK